MIYVTFYTDHTQLRDDDNIFMATEDNMLCMIHEHLLREINTLCSEVDREYDPSEPGELGTGERRLATILVELDKVYTVCGCDKETKDDSVREISEAMKILTSILIYRPAEWGEVSSCRDRITTSLLTLYNVTRRGG
jgi:hypothetical protein